MVRNQQVYSMLIRIRLLYSQFVICQILLLVSGVLLTVSCGREAGVFAVPAQRSLNLGPDPSDALIFVAMDDPQVDDYLVNDISPERGFRRWAFTRPELRFRLKDVSHLIFAAEFAIPEVTFKVTGPVTVSCAVNGRTLGSMRCPHAGDFRLVKPVPDGLVEVDKPVRVTFEANPRWISPEDGAQLSFLLRSAGFTH
jgi:hypothetical protein